MITIIPVNDIQQHDGPPVNDKHPKDYKGWSIDTGMEDASTTCDCCPRVEFGENGDMIIIHNAFDGRE